VTLAFIAER
jgi:hypothetical protein